MTVLANFKAVVIEHLGFVLVRMDSMELTVQVSWMCNFLKDTVVPPPSHCDFFKDFQKRYCKNRYISQRGLKKQQVKIRTVTFTFKLTISGLPGLKQPSVSLGRKFNGFFKLKNLEFSVSV